MAIKRLDPEVNVTKQWEVEVWTGQETPCLDAICQVGVTEQMNCHWKHRYGGVAADELKKLRRLRDESERM